MQVLLWIRLSVTFGYPATLTELRPISPKGFATLSHFASPLQTQPMFDVEKTSTGAQQYTTESHNTIEDHTYFTDSSETSPKYTNFPFDTTMHTRPNDTQILSIVRVSSTSVVKPRTRSRLATTVLTSTTNQHFTQTDADFGTKSKSETSFEELVTPFVSLLRKNRFDIDENYPKERSSIATARNYELPSYEVKFSRVTFDLSSSTRTVASNAGFGSFATKPTTTVETTTEATETTYTETYEPTSSTRERTSDTSYYDNYDERQYTQPRVYGEPEKVYGEPEKVYGEPEKVYGEPEKVYGEPEKVYGEPEKVYGHPEKVYGHEEKVYEPSTRRTTQETPKTFKAEEIIHEQPETEENEFQLPETSEMNSKSYSSFTTKINDKKSSYIVDNGTYRKYRVEEKTPDGFIVGEYGMVSHRDGSLRGVRYTADSNINPSLIYETLVKFLSLT